MSRAQRLVVVLTLNLALVAVLVIVGVAAHSLGVLAEGGDYLLDASGAGVALVALVLSRRPATARRPTGYPNATNIAALVNAGWLLLLEVIVATAAVVRLATGTPEVYGLPVLVVSGIAAVAMTVGALILRGDTPGEDDADGDLSITTVLLDTAADAGSRRRCRHGRDHPGDRRMVLARPGGRSPHRRGGRVSRACTSAEGAAATPRAARRRAGGLRHRWNC